MGHRQYFQVHGFHRADQFDATFFTMLYVFNCWTNPTLFQTGWFVESLLTQTLIIHIIRTAKIPFLQSRASASLITTSLIICGWHRSALHTLGRRSVAVHALAAALLGLHRGLLAVLRNLDALNQKLVRSALGDVNQFRLTFEARL